MNYNLDGVTKEEGRSYISEKLKSAGCNQTIFDDAASFKVKIEDSFNVPDNIIGTFHPTYFNL